MTVPPAFVLRLGPTGLTVVRALGRRGVPVVSLHSNSRDPSARSRYARARLLPPLEDREDAWLDALREEGRRLGGGPGVIFPIGDTGWLFLARHREELQRTFRFALPDADDLEEWPGKPFQYRAAVAAGVPVPKTVFPQSAEEAWAGALAVGMPCLIKPAHPHRWRPTHRWQKLVVAATAKEAVARWREAAERGLAVIVQEYIPGGDDQCFNVQSYLDRRGEPLATAVIRKIRQYPPGFGTSSISATVRDPAIRRRLTDLGVALLRGIRFHGISSAEFKRDARSGEFAFIELNLRPGMMSAVTIDDGINLPYIAYRDLLGERVPNAVGSGGDRKVVLISYDAQAFRIYRARGELTWGQWLRSLRGTREYYFGWDDPLPFIGHVARIVRGLVT